MRRSARDASSPATTAVTTKRDERDPVVRVFDGEPGRRQKIIRVRGRREHGGQERGRQAAEAGDDDDVEQKERRGDARVLDTGRSKAADDQKH